MNVVSSDFESAELRDGRKSEGQRLDRQVPDDRPRREHPRKLFLEDFPEPVVENPVEQRIGDRRQHPEQQRQGVPDRGHDGPFGQNFRSELEQHDVEDERSPADEEDGCDAGQQDVSVPPSAVDFLVLTWRSEN